MGGWRRWLLAVGAVALLAGCGGITRSELEEEAQARGGGLGSTLPREALDAIEEELGERPTFTGLNHSLQSVVVSVLVPGTDDALDTYTFTSNGDLLEPAPVSGAPPPRELRRSLMTDDDVALDDLDRIVDDALERADLPDGYASNVNVSRPSSDRVQILVTVASPRRNASVTYDGRGRFVDLTTA